MGHNTAFIGKVGNDFFGDQLRADMMLNKTEISEDILKETEMLNFANVVASIITTRKGSAASNARTRRNPTVFKYYQKCK